MQCNITQYSTARHGTSSKYLVCNMPKMKSELIKISECTAKTSHRFGTYASLIRKFTSRFIPSVCIFDAACTLFLCLVNMIKSEYSMRRSKRDMTEMEMFNIAATNSIAATVFNIAAR